MTLSSGSPSGIGKHSAPCHMFRILQQACTQQYHRIDLIPALSLILSVSPPFVSISRVFLLCLPPHHTLLWHCNETSEVQANRDFISEVSMPHGAKMIKTVMKDGLCTRVRWVGVLLCVYLFEGCVCVWMRVCVCVCVCVCACACVHACICVYLFEGDVCVRLLVRVRICVHPQLSPMHAHVCI